MEDRDSEYRQLNFKKIPNILNFSGSSTTSSLSVANSTFSRNNSPFNYNSNYDINNPTPLTNTLYLKILHHLVNIIILILYIQVQMYILELHYLIIQVKLPILENLLKIVNVHSVMNLYIIYLKVRELLT